MIKAKVVGYKNFTSKNGNALLVASFIVPLTDYEAQHGSVGMGVMKDLFIPDSCKDVFTPSCIDCECNIEGAWGRNKNGDYVYYVTRIDII